MKKFGLIGGSLSHSISPYIHQKLFEIVGTEAEYALYEIEELNAEEINKLANALDGFNVTSPHKEKVIKYLDTISDDANQYQAVNTVKVDKKLSGFNSDVVGLMESIISLKISFESNFLILGAGGSAQMAAVEIAKRGGKVTIAIRNQASDNTEKLVNLVEQISGAIIDVVDISNITDSYDALINCTPVGMYPHMGQSPVALDAVKKCGAVIDLIYNPAKTELLKYAQQANKPYIGGMTMLVYQAARSQDIWNGHNNFQKKDLDRIVKLGKALIKNIFENKKNVYVCVGFMATGKTTLCQAIATYSGLTFVDIDEKIVEKVGMPITEIFATKGEEYFRQQESDVLAEYLSKKDIVISTGGGSAVYNKDLLTASKALIFHINTPFEVCYDRMTLNKDRPLATNKKKSELLKLYNDRINAYEAIADIEIDGSLDLATQLLVTKDFVSHK